MCHFLKRRTIPDAWSRRVAGYAASRFLDVRLTLEALGMRGSMGRKDNPYDNAYAESFFKTLKHEEVYAYEYETMEDVIERLPHFIDQIYNRRRLHSALGYVPPEEYELQYARQEGQNPEAPFVYLMGFTPVPGATCLWAFRVASLLSSVSL